MNRSASLRRLSTETFDLCIIGGGASGAGCALDAALRGLKVVLIEKTDFAAETSSRSTKLIHGGVRYLEQAFKKLDFGQLRQVRHGLEERHILLANAPHLARPLALLTPVFSWWEGWYYALGLKLYDWFASGKDNLPASRRLRRAEALARLPALTPRLRGAVLYYDGQLDDARYCLALVQSASEAGAVVINHAEVIDFQKNEKGKILGAEVINQVSNEGEPTLIVRARQFLNCTGPFADRLRHLANPGLPPRIQPSKGAHVVLPAACLPGRDALLIPRTPDGRVVFAVPFGAHLLLGTTDETYPDLEKEPLLDKREVDFLLDTLQPYLAQPIDRQLVTAGFAGIRPLIKASAASTSATKRMLRDHEVERDAVSGLFSLLGGKWTTYRLMARDAVDAVCRQMEVTAACRTADFKLAGAAGYNPGDWKNLRRDFGFEEPVCRHLTQAYGDRAAQVAALTLENESLRKILTPGFPFLCAEVVWAARAEMACTVRDVLARRLRLEIADWAAAAAAAPLVARLLGEELGWPAARQQEEAAAYRALLLTFVEHVVRS